MSFKFCKNQLYSSYFLDFFITKVYTIFYYLHYFLLFSKFSYYFVWRNLPTNSNYLEKFTYYFRLLYNASYGCKCIGVHSVHVCIRFYCIHRYELSFDTCSLMTVELNGNKIPLIFSQK